jgi:hypothetical protein
VSEASQIWTSYGITVDAGETTTTHGVSLSLLVVLDTDHRASQGDDGLGTIRFAPNGTPDSTITLYCSTIVRLVTSTQSMGTDVWQWPADLRNHIIARALGRALAHELGHFVLRSPHHMSSGLMRARQHASALAEPSRKAFMLTEPDRARLQVVLTAQSPIASTRRILPVTSPADCQRHLT